MRQMQPVIQPQAISSSYPQGLTLVPLASVSVVWVSELRLPVVLAADIVSGLQEPVSAAMLPEHSLAAGWVSGSRQTVAAIDTLERRVAVDRSSPGNQ